MKDGKTSISLNLNLLTDKTKFEKIEEKLKMSFFGVLYLLLKHQDVNIWLEIIFIIFQFLQLLAFPFHSRFACVWKQVKVFTQVSNFLQYFQIVVFFKDNTEMYLIGFYVCIIILILMIINIIYVAVSISKNNLAVLWPLRLLRSVITFLVNVIFLPVFCLFISMFTCDSVTNVNFYAPGITCWSAPHCVHIIFSVMISIAYVIICILIQIAYFETQASAHNPSAKRCSRADVALLIIKILTVILFGFFSWQESSEWIIIVIMFFLSGYLFFIYYEEMPYYNSMMMYMYLSVTVVYFWSTTVLLIGKILEMTAFDGSLPLFFLGCPIVVFLLLTNYNPKLGLLLTNINKFQRGEQVLKQIRYFLDLVEKKDIDRSSNVVLQGYIFLFEESCTFSDCALKKYIASSLENKTDSVVFLLQHGESLYQNAISKFPNCTSLRISYAFFLFERLKKKQQANLELINTDKCFQNFEEQFIIYRYQKIIDEQSTDVSSSNDENLDIVSNITYKNHYNQFKNCISKVSTLYVEFWSLLLNPNQDDQEDLTKLNDYGSKINALVEEITSHFEKLQKVRQNDQEVIRCYSDFLYDILNDKEKALQLKSRLNDMEGIKQTYDEVNLLNVDTNALASSDEYQYIVISSQQEKFGIITNISLGVCSLFGYTRSELVGKQYDIIMPEIYHKGHKALLQNKLSEFKKLSLYDTSGKKYKPEFKDITSYGKNKSRYLIPLCFKAALVSNENNDVIFIAKIWQDFYNVNASQNQQICYILTNNILIIQNFTANAVNLLGIGSSVINGTIEITSFITQFHEEFLKCIVDVEDKTAEYTLSLKKKIINSKFRTQFLITWKKSDDAKFKASRTEEFGTTIILDHLDSSKKVLKDTQKLKSSSISNPFKEKNAVDENFFLTVTDIVINGTQEGYVFKFETVIDYTRRLSASLSGIPRVNVPSSKENEDAKVKSSSNESLEVEASKKTKQKFLDDVTIDKYYLPENTTPFALDPKKMSYMVNPKNPDELKKSIRAEAIQKMTLNTRDPTSTVKTEIEESEEADESGSNVDRLNSEEESESSSIYRSETETERNDDSNRNNKIKKKSNDEVGYYKVKMEKIKLWIYDYGKGIPVEREYQKVSHVDLKMNEDPRKREIEEYHAVNKGGMKEVSENIGEEGPRDNKGKETMLIKQIEYALNKEETQPTITKMKWISFFIFLGLLAIVCVFLGIFLKSMEELTENIILIEASYDLVMNTIYGIYHIRELTLLNNPRYVNIIQERKEYIANNTDAILQLFASSHQLFTEITTTFLPVHDDILTSNSTVYSTVLEDDFTISRFHLSLSSLLIESNSALYHIGHSDLSSILPTNKHVFFYLYNSVNDISVALKTQALVFIAELGLNMNSDKILFLLLFLSSVTFLIFSYCMLSFAYSAVAKRKESYLEVFFEIGNHVIKSSLEKCEKFSKTIQADSLSDAISNLDENEILDETMVIVSKDSGKKATAGGKKRRRSNSRETRVIKFKIVIGLMLIGLFFLLVFLFYQAYLDTLMRYIEILKSESIVQSEYLMLFNTVREYFFDPTTSVLTVSLMKYIDNALDSIYQLNNDNENRTSKNLIYFPADYSALYDQVYNNNICHYANDLVDCKHFAANSTSYGLQIVLTMYIEEIRYLKYLNDLHLLNIKKANAEFKYNSTLFNTSLGNSLIPTDGYLRNLYEMLDPFEIFNHDTLRDLGILNRFLLKPAFAALSTQLKKSIADSIYFTETVYIAMFAIFLTGGVCGYLFLWRPFQNGLNQTIYKTKNMLSIIPKEVLASLGNIYKLLDIGQNFAKLVAK